jgi:transcriptional regulator with GAF, ATPase, and Fis domain
LLSIASFITVPVKHGNSIIGRLFLGDTRPFALDTTDVSVLQQVAKHISALVQPLDVHAVLLFNTEPELSLTGEKTISGGRSQHEEALTLLRRWVSRAIRYVSSARRDKSVDKGMRDSPFRRS